MLEIILGFIRESLLAIILGAAVFFFADIFGLPELILPFADIGLNAILGVLSIDVLRVSGESALAAAGTATSPQTSPIILFLIPLGAGIGAWNHVRIDQTFNRSIGGMFSGLAQLLFGGVVCLLIGWTLSLFGLYQVVDYCIGGYYLICGVIPGRAVGVVATLIPGFK